MEFENWLPINKNYEVSCLGNVRNSKNLKVLKSWTTGVGYRKIQVGGREDRFRVHRLVCEAFCNNPNEEMYVDHINGIRHDNRAINLRWCSQRQNMAFSRQSK